MKKEATCVKDKLNELLIDQLIPTDTFSSQIWKNVEVLEAKSDGYLKLRMKVEHKHCNPNDVIHGGMTSGLMDILGSWSVLLADDFNFSVSTDLNIIFMSPGKLGDNLILEAKCDKLGRTLAYSSIKIYSEIEGKVVATGMLTKMRINNKL